MDTPAPPEVTDITATYANNHMVLSENTPTFTFDENGKRLEVPRALKSVGLYVRVCSGTNTTIGSVRSRLLAGQSWETWTPTTSGFLSRAFRDGDDFELEIADGNGVKTLEGGGYIFVEDEGGGGLGAP